MTIPSNSDEEDFIIDVSTFEPDQEEEGFLEKTKRHSSRGLARSLETLAGLPGDLRELGQSLITKGFGKLMGDPQQAEDIAEKISPFLQAAQPPTKSSQDIREQGTQALTGDYLEPQSEGEELGDEIVSDVVSLAAPVKGKIPFARSLIGGIGGNVVKEAVKESGGGDTAQTLSKLGTMFLLGNLGRQGAKNYVRNLHKEAEALIPEGAKVSTKDIASSLRNVKKSLQSGGITPDKSPSLNLVNQLEKKIRQGGGEITPQELRNFRQSVNELRFNRKTSDRGRFFLDRVDDVLNEGLIEYGKDNPAFLNKYREANLGTKGLKESNKLARSISKKIDITKLSPEALILLGVHNTLSPSLLGKLGLGAAGAKAAQITKRLTTNPTLRTHYLNTLKAASKENWKSFNRNLNMLEKELSKGDKGEELEVLDFTEDSP